MKISAALQSVTSLYMETAPLIYYVEENSVYIDRMEEIVTHIEAAQIRALSSVITLTEVLTLPLRLGQTQLVQAYQKILTRSNNFQLLPVTTSIAVSAADLHARYNLRTPDALHIATAIDSGCNVF